MEDQYKKMEEAVEVDDKTQEIVNKYKEKYLGPESPYHKANWISLATFGWLNPMFEVSPQLATFTPSPFSSSLKTRFSSKSTTTSFEKSTLVRAVLQESKTPGRRDSLAGLNLQAIRPAQSVS